MFVQDENCSSPTAIRMAPFERGTRDTIWPNPEGLGTQRLDHA